MRKLHAPLLMLLAVLAASSVSAAPPTDSGLPPGIEKRLQQGKPLPPGWAKKMNEGDVLDERIYSRGTVVGPVGEDGAVTLEVEGETMRIIETTREIVEILGR